MSRRRDRAEQAAPPVAELPEQLGVYDPAEWLPPDVVEPDGDSAAAWQVWERAHEQAHGEWLAAREHWHATHELPPLRIDRLPPDEPYTPPPNKVTGADLPGGVEVQADGEPRRRRTRRAAQ
ncbi:hypothetical protein [Mycolicibacterium gilvum]|uniref:hypothetical protein n=1 Tax=Mycolicibacterium gilvum TaxID=1804 RepID=UPI0040459BCD